VRATAKEQHCKKLDVRVDGSEREAQLGRRVRRGWTVGCAACFSHAVGQA
jgi:hypothetical protein